MNGAAWAPEPIERITVVGLLSDHKKNQGEEIRPKDDLLSIIKIKMGGGVQAEKTKLYGELSQRGVEGLELLSDEPESLMISRVKCGRTIRRLGRNKHNPSTRRNPCYHLFTQGGGMTLEVLPNQMWKLTPH